MSMGNLFTEHPQALGETYAQHLLAAGGFGARMIIELNEAMIAARGTLRAPELRISS